MEIFQILAGDACEGLGPIVSVIKGVFNILKIGIPIVLILMGAVDLGKAVIASDDKEIKGATGKLIKRAIAAVAVFFAVTIVDVVMGLVAKGDPDGGSTGWSDCWNSR